MKKFTFGLLPRVALAIVLGIVFGLFVPVWTVRIFTTFNGLFSNFLGFIIPLLILGLVAPAIADLGKGAGKLLLVTVAIAYGSTLFSGFFTYGICEATYASILSDGGMTLAEQGVSIDTSPFFTVAMPPLMEVMTALLLAFVLGLGMAFIVGSSLKNMMDDFRDIINKVIANVIVPILPLFISSFGGKYGVA